MEYDFDTIVPRRGTDCEKWDLPAEDSVLPHWVADMDFRAAPAIVDALRRRVDEGVFGKGDIIRYNIYQIIGNIIAWIIVAPVLDIVIYAEPVNLVFTQGVVAAITNAISAGVIGTVLLLLYSKTRAGKGTLKQED